jgi:Holliday junction resolvase RusA-like endonuclease
MGAVQIVDFEVDGVPVQQGSKTGFVAGGRAIVTDQNKKTLKPWRQNVTATARAAHPGDRLEGPVLMVVEFRFVRPKTVKREWPAVQPDLDKLLRALLDGITDSGLWRDDAQVVTAHVSKVYADRPGVRVQIGEYIPTPNEKRKK